MVDASGFLGGSLGQGLASAAFDQVGGRLGVGGALFLELGSNHVLAASLAFGLFVSTLVRTQQQAMQVSFFYLLPNILLSGFMFPRQAMPLVFQWISLALPLTHFLTVLRGILLKGLGLEALWRETAILLGFSVLLITLAVLVILGLRLRADASASVETVQDYVSSWSDIVRVVPAQGREDGASLGYACGYTRSGRELGRSGRVYRRGRFEVEVWHVDYILRPPPLAPELLVPQRRQPVKAR